MREDWSEIQYKDIVKKISLSNKKLKQKEYLPSGKIPVIDQGQELIGGYTDDESKLLDCKLPCIVFGDHTKIVKLINFPFASGADGTKVIEPKEHLEPKLLKYFTEVLALKIKDKGYARHYQDIEKSDIVIPPKLEQKAIVAKIEQLFSELDNAVANLKTAQAKLKIYRQAVLKKAFEGLPQINFEQIIHSSQNGLSKRSGKEGEFYKVLRLADIKDFQIVENEPRSIQMNQNEIEKYKLEIDDLICTRVNGSKDLVGTFTLFHNDTNWAFCDHFIRLKLDENSISRFYFYFLQTREVRKYIHDNMVSSAGQNTVSQTTVKAIKVPTCSIAEQNKIVQEIESRLSVCDKIEETIETSLVKSEALRQSILKKAFEGKLLSVQELENIKNHPEYESAETLLENIKKERTK